MKKFLSMLVASLLCVCAFGLVGCGPTTPNYAGTYKISSMSAEGMTLEIGSAEATDLGFTEDYMVLVFNTDGTYTITMTMDSQSMSQTGTWTLGNGCIDVTVEGNTQSITIINDTTLSISIPQNDATAIFKKV